MDNTGDIDIIIATEDSGEKRKKLCYALHLSNKIVITSRYLHRVPLLRLLS